MSKNHAIMVYSSFMLFSLKIYLLKMPIKAMTSSLKLTICAWPCSYKKVMKSSKFEILKVFHISIQSYCTKIRSLAQKWQKLSNFYFFVILWETDSDFWNLLTPTFTKCPIVLKMILSIGFCHHWKNQKAYLTDFQQNGH